MKPEYCTLIRIRAHEGDTWAQVGRFCFPHATHFFAFALHGVTVLINQKSCIARTAVTTSKKS